MTSHYIEAKKLYNMEPGAGGLMPAIQTLIAPPPATKNTTAKEGLDKHPYYKKRGRSHNHDYCDSCTEGGDLLCCDTCQASFHLMCHDPPYFVDEIPDEGWQCKRCVNLGKISPGKIEASEVAVEGMSSGKNQNGPDETNKRCKSTNINTSTTTTTMKKLKTSFANIIDNGGGSDDSMESNFSSESSSKRGRGRPRKYKQLESGTSFKHQDSDNESESFVKTSRFLRKRKQMSLKEPNSSDEDFNDNDSNGAASCSSKYRRDDKFSKHSSILSSLHYFEYSSSDDDNSRDKGLDFRDMIESNKSHGDNLDESTGEFSSSTLADRINIQKMINRKDTSSKYLDDVDEINQILRMNERIKMKMKMKMMNNDIIQKVIGLNGVRPSSNNTEVDEASTQDKQDSSDLTKDSYLKTKDVIDTNFEFNIEADEPIEEQEAEKSNEDLNKSNNIKNESFDSNKNYDSISGVDTNRDQYISLNKSLEEIKVDEEEEEDDEELENVIEELEEDSEEDWEVLKKIDELAKTKLGKEFKEEDQESILKTVIEDEDDVINENKKRKEKKSLKEPQIDSMDVEMTENDLNVNETGNDNDDARSLDDIEIDLTDKNNSFEVQDSFRILLQAASTMYPSQFTFEKYIKDKSLLDKYVFPGSDKVSENLKVKSKRFRKFMNIVDLDSDSLVPRPLNICYNCGVSCKKGLLIGCDYCNLYYHFDCLTPPMTALPTITWICPNHPQTMIDTILGRENVGMVEKSNVWDTFTMQPLNSSKIEQDFLKKANREVSQAVQTKKMRRSIPVPDHLKEMCDRRKEETVSLRHSLPMDVMQRSVQTSRTKSTREEQDQFLKGLINLQTSLMLSKYEKPPNNVLYRNGGVYKFDIGTIDTENELNKETINCNNKTDDNSTTNEKSTDNSTPNTLNESVGKLDTFFPFNDDFITSAETPYSNNVSNFKLEDINTNFKVEDIFITSTNDEPSIDKSETTLNKDNALSVLNEMEEERNKKIDDKESIKKDDDDITEKVDDDDDDKKTKNDDGVIVDSDKTDEKDEMEEDDDDDEEEVNTDVKIKKNLFLELNDLFRNAKDPEDGSACTTIDFSDIHQLDADLIKLLALEKISDLLKDESPINNSLPDLPPNVHPYFPFVPSNDTPPVRVHAQLCPLRRKIPPIEMKSISLTIGNDHHHSIDLTRYGRCSRVSIKHATIFHEACSNSYELVNMSEYGTKVDGVKYTLDFGTVKPNLNSNSRNRKKSLRDLIQDRINESPFIFDTKEQRIRVRKGMEINRRKRRRRRNDDDDDDETLPEHYGETFYKCACIIEEEEEEKSSGRKRKSAKYNKNNENNSSESTCVLSHGSLIEFGCFKFVFSITDFDKDDTDDDDDDDTEMSDPDFDEDDNDSGPSSSSSPLYESRLNSPPMSPLPSPPPTYGPSLLTPSPEKNSNEQSNVKNDKMKSKHQNLLLDDDIVDKKDDDGSSTDTCSEDELIDQS